MEGLNTIVEGSIGVGKTTALVNMEKELNLFWKRKIACTIPEPVSLWENFFGMNMLKETYLKPKEYGFRFQTLALSTMAENFLLPQQEEIKIYERSPKTSTAVFGRKFEVDNVISSNEMNILKNLECTLLKNKDMNKADIYLYLKADPAIVYNRINKRSRDGEEKISLELIYEMDTIYDEYMKEVTEEVFVIDAMRDPNEVAKQCVSIINEQYMKKKASNASSVYLTPEK